jgi:hypothetical protein
VIVRVVEAGHHGPALEAYHALRVEVAAQLVPVTHRDDPAAQHGQRCGSRPRRVHGQEGAALEDSIDAHGMLTHTSRGRSPSTMIRHSTRLWLRS